jgi:tetratricopeptide (TPR) repeat protein
MSCEGFGEQILYNKADTAHRNGEYETAIRIYKKLLADDPQDKKVPNNALLHYDLGIAYIDIGNRKKVPKQIEILKKMGREDLAKELKRAYIISDSYTHKKRYQ